MTEPIVILGAARTPIGRYRGALRAWPAPRLGAHAIAGALAGCGLGRDDIDECLMGCVLPAGQGQAPARQAALAAGLPRATRCTTVNKMCGSGMKTVAMAADQIQAGTAGAAIAGGMESMTRAPFLAWRDPKTGKRDESRAPGDHLFLDGLEDAYDPGRSMGSFAEDCAERYQFTRAEQDVYAVGSLANAQQAAARGVVADEIIPLAADPDGIHGTLQTDELPQGADPARIPTLKPAFREGGTVTAANASAISDGAAALVLAGAKRAAAAGLPVRATLRAHTAHAQEPEWFTTAPVPAIQAVLAATGWAVEDVDLWEINEAFAVVPMVAMKELGIPRARLNVRGGACALGHPIGASGARILVTLLCAMEAQDAARGVAAICIGGGEAMAVALERTPSGGEPGS